jgi:hypothetical protein
VTFCYRVYGIGIESATSIPGLEPIPPSSTSPVNLKFESGTKPEWVSRALQLDGRVVVHRPGEAGTGDPTLVVTEHGNAEFYELAYADGTLFVVSRGANRVWGSVPPPQTDEDLATYFLGPVMGYVLRQRHVTCLHASAVELQGHGVLFSGDAGYGKSTTAGALALRGIPVLAEDIVPLELAEEQIWVTPGYPRVCLWPEAVEKLVGQADGLPKLTPGWEKRFLPLDGVRGKFVAEKRPLGAIYVLGERRREADAPRIEEMTPREALLALVQKTYMNYVLDRARRAKEFDEVWKIVRKVPVRRIIAHEDADKIGALCKLIVADAARVLPGMKV